MKCDFHDRECKYCLHHETEARRCKVDNLPVGTGVCHVPCGGCEDIKKS